LETVRKIDPATTWKRQISSGMLLLTNHAHNKEVLASKRRDWRRGCSEATVDRVFANEDAVRRLLCEFESLDEVGTLRRCNKGLGLK